MRTVASPVSACNAITARRAEDAHFCTIAPMEPWVVVVIRAWSEGGNILVRMLRAGPSGDPEARLATSPADAARLLSDWLEQLRPDGPSDEQGLD